MEARNGGVSRVQLVLGSNAQRSEDRRCFQDFLYWEVHYSTGRAVGDLCTARNFDDMVRESKDSEVLLELYLVYIRRKREPTAKPQDSNGGFRSYFPKLGIQSCAGRELSNRSAKPPNFNSDDHRVGIAFEGGRSTRRWNAATIDSKSHFFHHYSPSRLYTSHTSNQNRHYHNTPHTSQPTTANSDATTYRASTSSSATQQGTPSGRTKASSKAR